MKGTEVWGKEKIDGSDGPLEPAQTSMADLLDHALPPVQRTPALLSDGSPGLSSLSDPLKYYLPDQISLNDSEQFPSRNRFQEQALPGPFLTPISELRIWRERARRGDERKGFLRIRQVVKLFTLSSPGLPTEGCFESQALLISIFPLSSDPPLFRHGAENHISLWGLGINLKQIVALKCFNPQTEIVFQAFIPLILFPTCPCSDPMCK